MDETRAKVIDLDLNDILPNRFQPRIKFSEESIIELSESIKEHGVIQPIIVRPIGDKYEIIAGERRYKASVLAGKETIPAIISSLNDKDSAEIALIENVQRRDLTAIEEAISYKKILDMGYLTQEQLAIKLGKSQSAVANKIRLLNLCDEVQEALMEDKISERHARAILKLKDIKNQKQILEKIITERLTVRKTEEEIEKMNTYITSPIDDPVAENNSNVFSPVNPGFVDVEKIENQAKSIDPEQKVVDFNALLMKEPVRVDETPTPSIPSLDSVVNPTPAVDQVPTMNPMVENNFSNAFMGTLEVPTMEEAKTIEPTVPVESPMTTPDIQPNMMNNVTQFDSVSTISQVQSPIQPMDGGIPTTPIVEQPTIASNSMMDIPTVDIPTVDSFVPPVPSIEVPPVPTIEAISPVEPATPVAEKKVTYEDFLANSTPIETYDSIESIPTVDPFTTAPSMQQMSPIPKASEIPTTPIVENHFPNAFIDTPEVPTLEEPLKIEETEEPKDVETSDTVKSETMSDIQPIIITDYSKQYDPVLPPSQQPIEKVDFKKIINLIRDVNDTIEKCGYTIETEEYDLENEYQVLFKINKN